MFQNTNVNIKTELINKVHYISSIDRKTARKILFNYFAKDKYYTRIQNEALQKNQVNNRKYIDLNYLLVPVTDEMFISVSNAWKFARVSKNNPKYIYASKITNEIKENPLFNQRLEQQGAIEIYIPRKVLTYAIENLLKDNDYAVIMFLIYGNINIKGLKLIFSKLNTLKKSKDKAKNKKYKNKYKTALNSLIESVIYIQDNTRLYNKIVNGSDK